MGGGRRVKVVTKSRGRGEKMVESYKKGGDCDTEGEMVGRRNGVGQNKRGPSLGKGGVEQMEEGKGTG